MNTPSQSDIAAALDLCIELTQTPFSPAARQAILNELMQHEPQAVLHALHHCSRQHNRPLTLADILNQLDPHRIRDAETWYAHISAAWQDESLTIVVPKIAMDAADENVLHLFRNGDHTGARLAFSQAYHRLHAQATAPIRWIASLGHDREQRQRALLQAQQKGQLTAEQIRQLLPPPSPQTHNAPPQQIAQHIQAIIQKTKL